MYPIPTCGTVRISSLLHARRHRQAEKEREFRNASANLAARNILRGWGNEHGSRQLTFYAFDPLRLSSSGDVQETKRLLFAIGIEPGHEPNWDVSPDGSLLAIAAQDEHAILLRFVALNSRPGFQVTVKGWGNEHSLLVTGWTQSLYFESFAVRRNTPSGGLAGACAKALPAESCVRTVGGPSPNGPMWLCLAC